jgi:xanthine dehydrogenase small subunit
MVAANSIRFVLDGEIIEIRNPDPTRTILQYLREDLRRTGTKEGCAEGDCGACTVALVELDSSGEKAVYKAVNSCIQFLPTLDGKELITVEGLKDDTGKLHPAQQAMVDCHGSQCGFCTPGFVMSLFVLYQQNPTPSRSDVDIALSGNLCRCTAYRPIIDAAQSMAELSAPEFNEQKRADRLMAVQRQQALSIDAAGRRFFAPRMLEDLAALYGEYPDAVLLAGGTDVGLLVSKELQQFDTVIFCGNVPQLCGIESSNTHLEIGAGVTISAALPAVLEHHPQLEELFLRFASPPIRNSATLGGNIANGSPIGDSMPALMVLGCRLRLRRGRSTREVLLEEFYVDYQQTLLRRGEFIECILVPLPDGRGQMQSYKVSKRFDQDISALCGAFWVQINGPIVTGARIAYGGMAAVPKRAARCEAALLGIEWTEGNVRRAALALDDDFEPISDMRASADYRRKVCANLLMRFFMDTQTDDAQGVYRYGR